MWEKSSAQKNLTVGAGFKPGTPWNHLIEMIILVTHHFDRERNLKINICLHVIFLKTNILFENRKKRCWKIENIYCRFV